MKTAIPILLLAMHLANPQKSSAFVDCGYAALCFCEEIPEDETVPEPPREEPNPPAEPVETGPAVTSV